MRNSLLKAQCTSNFYFVLIYVLYKYSMPVTSSIHMNSHIPNPMIPHECVSPYCHRCHDKYSQLWSSSRTQNRDLPSKFNAVFLLCWTLESHSNANSTVCQMCQLLGYFLDMHSHVTSPISLITSSFIGSILLMEFPALEGYGVPPITTVMLWCHPTNSQYCQIDFFNIEGRSPEIGDQPAHVHSSSHPRGHPSLDCPRLTVLTLEFFSLRCPSCQGVTNPCPSQACAN